MGRRRSDSLVEDVAAIAAKLPWPVGVVLAGVFFVGLHSLAEIEMPTKIAPSEAHNLRMASVRKVRLVVLAVGDARFVPCR